MSQQTPGDPLCLFEEWFRDAANCSQIRYPHAATLATVTRDAGADARIVLVHSFDRRGFVVSTDEASPKARQLAANPHASLVFYWEPLERQVRIRGRCEPGTDQDADACFAERPRESRITAWASRQSREVSDRAEIDLEWAGAAEPFAGTEDVPRPEHWRAYRLMPSAIEFWQAARYRLHDRFLYETLDAKGESWRRRRLAP